MHSAINISTATKKYHKTAGKWFAASFQLCISRPASAARTSTMHTMAHTRDQVLKIYGASTSPVKKQSQAASNLQKK